MSVSDPLIKDIKGHALSLFKDNERHGKITENNKSLINFCKTLECIFYKGSITIHQNGFYGFRKVDVLGWMFKISQDENNILLTYKTVVERVRKIQNVYTSLGKFRLLMRYCLVKKCLHAPLEALIKSQSMHYFYQKNSILGDEILAAILLSVLLQCNKLNFELDLENASFLDCTWLIPEIIRLELVPCRNLGISVSFSENKAVIVNIEDNSVAAESDQISKGDILDGLNNIVINGNAKGRLQHIFNVNRGKPITLTIIKPFTVNKSNHNEKEIFLPIKKLLDNLRLDNVFLQEKNDVVDALKNEDDGENEINKKEEESKSVVDDDSIKPSKFGYELNYLGAINVGDKGNIKQIEEAMRILMNTKTKNRNGNGKIIWMEIGELCIKVFNCTNGQEMFKHTYMEISACGSPPNFPHYFAYIKGNKNCDSATEFICHIFHVKDTEIACTILQSIGQGFHRTHFAV